jgi:hypothetical protein
VHSFYEGAQTGVKHFLNFLGYFLRLIPKDLEMLGADVSSLTRLRGVRRRHRRQSKGGAACTTPP